jgi:hypothetical protein
MLAVIFLISSFTGFCVYFKQLKMLPEYFAFLYQKPVSEEKLTEECRRQQIPCEIQESDIGAEDVQRESEKFQAVLVGGIEAMDYGRVESLFSDSDVRIDVSLLKWMTAILVLGCFALLLLLVFYCYEKWGCKKWVYGVTFLFWAMYVKYAVFDGMPEFPLWSLPGRWSDFEGWGEFWQEVENQLCCIIRFWDHSVVSGYCECMGKSVGYLAVFLAAAADRVRRIGIRCAGKIVE